MPASAGRRAAGCPAAKAAAPAMTPCTARGWPPCRTAAGRPAAACLLQKGRQQAQELQQHWPTGQASRCDSPQWSACLSADLAVPGRRWRSLPAAKLSAPWLQSSTQSSQPGNHGTCKDHGPCCWHGVETKARRSMAPAQQATAHMPTQKQQPLWFKGHTCRLGTGGCEVGVRWEATACTAEAAAALVWHPVLLLLQHLRLLRLALQGKDAWT